MNALQVIITLDTPLLVTGIGNGDENSGRTLPYLPGAALRGLLIGRYAPGSRADLPADERARHLFFSGAVRFLNAYPYVRDARALPTPASWRVEKHADLKDEPTAVDFALTAEHDLAVPERVTQPFSRLEDDTLEVFDVRRTLNIHISSEQRGRVEKGKSTVFRYEALAAGQSLAALIVADEAGDLAEVRRLIELDPQTVLGGSRSAGYGHVTLSVKAWHGAEAPGGESDEVVTLTLLSDALLLNESGQPTLNLDSALSAVLKRPIEHQRAFVKPVRVGGFNRQWQLPLIQQVAPGMGSVYVYDAPTFTAAELQTLAEHGLGDRRVEGFGRLAVNWPGHNLLRLKDLTAEQSAPFTATLSSGSQTLAQELGQRLLRADLDERLRATVLNKLTVVNRPPNHQLSRLRLAVRQALLTDERLFAPVQQHLADLKSTAAHQFERARVRSDQSNDRLRTWLASRLDHNDGLALIGGEHQVVQVADQSRTSDERLRREYTLRLIDGVLRRAMKDNRGLEGQA